MSETSNYIGEFFESTFMYFRNPFAKLNFHKFILTIPVQNDFEIYVAYSYDNRNYSDFRHIENYVDGSLDEDQSLYVCFWLKRNIDTDLSIPTGLYDTAPTDHKYYGNFAQSENVPRKDTARIVIQSILYDGQEITPNDVEFQEYFRLVDEFPRWNFYDNQLITIQRWLFECNAIAEMYGHTVIYFKTEPVELDKTHPQTGIHGIHKQIGNNVIRNVVDVKKLHVLLPNNEIPNDRVIYSDWDMPLQDDFMIHVVRQKFEQAFGLKAIPQEKDYIYFPLVNKLFRVSTFQPRNGFMGVVGWYEVFLSKYEEDECVVIKKELKDNITSKDNNQNSNLEASKFSDGIEALLGTNGIELQDELWNELSGIKDDTILSEKEIDRDVVEEQKTATQRFTNKLEDSTFYVSLKETERQRELYDKRLQIVSVNPDEALFPITMYDCSQVPKRTLAMKYRMTDYSVRNQFSNICRKSFRLTFNFVMTGRFNGELFDVMSPKSIGKNGVGYITPPSNAGLTAQRPPELTISKSSLTGNKVIPKSNFTEDQVPKYQVPIETSSNSPFPPEIPKSVLPEIPKIPVGDSPVSPGFRVFSLSIKNRKLTFSNAIYPQETPNLVDYKLDLNELYQVSLETGVSTGVAIKIFKLNNRIKSLVYQNIYNIRGPETSLETSGLTTSDIPNKNPISFEISNLYMYGGSYLVNDIIFEIDDQKFIEDNCLPLLNMAPF